MDVSQAIRHPGFNPGISTRNDPWSSSSSMARKEWRSLCHRYDRSVTPQIRRPASVLKRDWHECQFVGARTGFGLNRSRKKTPRPSPTPHQCFARGEGKLVTVYGKARLRVASSVRRELAYFECMELVREVLRNFWIQMNCRKSIQPLSLAPFG